MQYLKSDTNKQFTHHYKDFKYMVEHVKNQKSLSERQDTDKKGI